MQRYLSTPEPVESKASFFSMTLEQTSKLAAPHMLIREAQKING